MVTRLGIVVMWVALATATAGCPNGKVNRPYAEPTAEALLQRLEQRNQQAQSFRAKSTMDYWVGGQRVRGTVWVQGKKPELLRFNALNPGSGNVAVDLACPGDGNFKYLNYNDNCKLVGRCNEQSIAQLLRLQLQPNDFLLLAMGSTPVIEGNASLSWDANNGYEVVTIEGPGGRTQTIKIDMKSDRFEVIESVVRQGDQIEWKLTSKDFGAANGVDWRVPGKSRFEQPTEKADLIAEWQERTFNLDLDNALFDFQLNMGIPTCP